MSWLTTTRCGESMSALRAFSHPDYRAVRYAGLRYAGQHAARWGVRARAPHEWVEYLSENKREIHCEKSPSLKVSHVVGVRGASDQLVFALPLIALHREPGLGGRIVHTRHDPH